MSLLFKIPLLVAMLATLIAIGPASTSAQITESDLQAKVEEALVTHNLVGIGAAVTTSEAEYPVLAVAGERKRGSGDMIHWGDAWHIGSNTKMLTALTYARLVADGKAEWGAPLASFFPELADDIHPDWVGVTIEDLLSHRAGLPANPDKMWMIARAFDASDLAVQRQNLARKVLTAPMMGQYGEYSYSNTGYILAGAVIESIASQHSEKAAFEEIFSSLFRSDLNRVGGQLEFGPPEKGIQGHRKSLFGDKLTGVGYRDTADNPKVYGPAGTMNISLGLHIGFLAKHFLNGDPDIKQKLLTPHPNEESDYALGWGIADIANIGTVYGHSGSNTMWLSNVTYAPSLDAIVIVNINQFNDDARAAVREVTADILEQIADAR